MLNIPRTPLSMTHHAAIPEYRDEMHHDLETSYRRFALDGSLAWLSTGKDVPTSAQVRGATEKVDLGAYLRRKENNVAALENAVTEFFKLMAPILLEELVKGVDAPDQKDNWRGDLGHRSDFLSALYHLFYSKEFRGRATSDFIFGQSADANTAALRTAWEAVRARLRGEASVTPALEGHVKTLCDKLTLDFNDHIWIDCW